MHMNEMKIRTEFPPTLVLAQMDHNDCIIHSIYEDFRIVVECTEDIQEQENMIISCYSFDDSRYLDFQFSVLVVEKIEIHKYSAIYDVTLKGNFEECYSCIEKIYSILDRKGTNSIGGIREFMKGEKNFCNYQYKKDQEFYDDYRKQRELWYKQIYDNKEYDIVMKNVEMAYFFNNFNDYAKIIENGCRKTIQDNIEADGIAGKGIFRKGFERVYIGSEFCHNMLPEKEQLKKIMDICIAESYKITIAFPYLMESEIDYEEEKLAVIDNTAKENRMLIEVIINDYGMIELVKKYQNLVMIWGRLQNKRKKDPRIKYMWSDKNHMDLFKENMLNNDFYIDKLKQIGVTRFEMESFSVDNSHINGKCSIHFPFYQINTSMFCTMYAHCKNNNKLKQSQVYECPRYCENYVYIYPKHLNIIGCGNSVFGFDNKMLVSIEHLKSYIKMGIDRLVFSEY